MVARARIGIVGGTGYTGVELLRILIQHPRAQVVLLTSRSEAGMRADEFFPSLRGRTDVLFSDPETADYSQCDLVFFATPNGVAMRQVKPLLALGVKIIDLAADFRLQDPAVYAKWYGVPHACPELLEEAVYGLPEGNRKEIKGARLVANPGCYPTSVLLGFLPLIEADWVDPASLIADCKSGVSGAGRKAEVHILFSEVSDNFKAYGISGHRHLPEITQGLNRRAAQAVTLVFSPHLTPMIRGIHATLYAGLRAQGEIQALYEQRYADEPFVDVMPAGSHPDTRSVRGANVCRLAIHRPQGGNTVVILSVIDNLVKGAAGQAVQNMNLMLGFVETAGLDTLALVP